MAWQKVRFVFEIVSAIFIWEVSYKEELNRWIQYDTSASKLFLKPDLKYGTGQLPRVKAFVILGKKQTKTQLPPRESGVRVKFFKG